MSPSLDPRLTHYVQRVRSIAREPLSEAAKLRRVRVAAAELVAGPLQIGPEFRRVPERGYGRNLLHRDAETGFVVIAMIWPPGAGGTPHDHGTWGVVAVAEGEVEVTNFEREDDGSDERHATLRSLGTIHAQPGAVAWVLPPHEDFHAVRNPSARGTAVTIHTYGHEPRRFHAVELATRAVELRDLSYDNVPG